MKPRIIIAFLLVILILPVVTAVTIGTVKQSNCINLYQICENCTENNITTILYPLNRTVADHGIRMTKNETYYNYTYCDTTSLGRYIVNGVGDLDGDLTSWVYDFEVTGTGFSFTQSRSSFTFVILGTLMFLFLLTIYSIPKIPRGNTTDDYGMLMSINHLKYLRPVLYCIAWIILIGIVFTTSNVALAYMGTEMFGQLLFSIYQVMFWITIPGVFIWFIFIVVQIFRDAEMKRMLERGIDIQSP